MADQKLVAPRMVQIIRQNEIMKEKINLFPWKYEAYINNKERKKHKSKLEVILQNQIYGIK